MKQVDFDVRVWNLTPAGTEDGTQTRAEKAPQGVLDKIKSELQPLRESAFDASRPLKEEIVKANDQAVKNMEARQKIFKQRKQL